MSIIILTQKGDTALHLASKRGNIDAVRELVNGHAVVNVVDKVWTVLYSTASVINPRRACAARVTVLGLSICVSVCLSVCLPFFSNHRQQSGT